MTLAEKHKIKAEEKKLEKEEARAKFRLNQIKPTTNACFNILFVLLSFVCLFPVFYVFMISVSSTDSITKYGYRLFPDTYSTAAYTFLWNERGTIFNSLIISVVVTVMGTVLGVLLTTMIGYVLSRPNYKLKGFFTWMVFIPMIFNGGMVANYVVVANMLHLNNTIWCLVLPLAMSSFNVIICKTFFRTTVPEFHSDGNQRRDYIYVDDLIALALRVVEHPQKGFDAVNVSSNQSYSVRELYAIANRLMGKNIEAKYCPSSHYWAKYPELYGGAYGIKPGRCRALYLRRCPNVRCRILRPCGICGHFSL